MAAACIFCKIIKGTLIPPRDSINLTNTNHLTGEIPSMKLFESDKVFAFLDINPLSYGHAVSFSAHPPLQSLL
jgi:diadenosine tetraphosphate (Ap4A) HIT family hydrolase